jgi:formate hydrogenlyase subunit 3/multisubunit Na+/H+ antiporter MnhD subunit
MIPGTLFGIDPVLLLLITPLAGGVVLALAGARQRAPEINIGFSLLTLVVAAVLAVRVIASGPLFGGGKLFFVDPLNVFLVSLTAFVGFTTALFSGPYMRIERDHGRMTPNRMRLFHSMYQLFMFTMLLALLTNNMGILWVAMEGATLATVLLVSVYRTRASLEAAWKYFILCGVGIALALFGTILLYLAADRQLGSDSDALLWTNLNAVKTSLEPAIMSLSFVFLLVGYGTKMGLVPLHSWLPDAHAEGPTPISAVLSGLLLNVALYAVLRFKVLADGALHNGLPGKLLVGFGLLSVLVAAFSLSRQKDVKRMFSYSSIEHIGLMTFAFGLGGPVATYAGLLHMTVHSLVKSAIFFSVGHAAQKAGTQVMDQIRGLINISPTVGWGMLLGTLAILGMPPFGVFASEFLIITTAMRELPWAAPVLLLALGVAFAAIFGRVQGMVFGETNAQPLAHPPALLPVFIHLGLALMLGLYIPPYLHDWFRQAVNMIVE